MTVKVDVDGDGVADGVFVSTESLATILEWETENRHMYDDMVVIIESK